jgi:hypothetical protein
MLGINTPGDRLPRPYRNYAAVTPGDPEFIELERVGAVEIYSRRGEYDWYRCTDEGKIAAMRSHRGIRYSRPKRRYIRYLNVRESIPSLTFRDFLVDPQFARIRADA